VRSFDVVTAVGNALHVDAQREPDLFWALRGGGGAPVVVTSIELELFPLREAFGGSLLWPLEQASQIVHGYREWIANVPDSHSLVRPPAWNGT
jgi:FAD/FMN-containing dehydrogenase